MDTKDWYAGDVCGQEEDIAIIEYDITSTPNDFNVTTLFNLMDNNIIKIPPFQRNYVWDEKRASKFIESIILGLPIPQVFLYEKGKDNFLIIDGQQRLLSVYFFIKQRFPTKEGRKILRKFLLGEDSIDKSTISDDRYFKNFMLKLPSPSGSEKNKYDSTKFDTLGEAKHSFEFLRTIRSVVIKQNSPDDNDSSMYEVFNRLNTGGQNLKPQEIRMSLYFSDFYKILFKINTHEQWRDILGQKEPDINFKDIEILVRSFAMLFFSTEYKAPLTKFLNRFSKYGENFSAKQNEYLENLFYSFLECCNDLLPKSFFSSNNKFNISLFESVFVSVCTSFFLKKELITKKIDNESLQRLKKDAEFLEAIQSNIASKKSVKTRIERAKSTISLI